jgi:hypothetical protein
VPAGVVGMNIGVFEKTLGATLKTDEKISEIIKRTTVISDKIR